VGGAIGSPVEKVKPCETGNQKRVSISFITGHRSIQHWTNEDRHTGQHMSIHSTHTVPASCWAANPDTRADRPVSSSPPPCPTPRALRVASTHQNRTQTTDRYLVWRHPHLHTHAHTHTHTHTRFMRTSREGSRPPRSLTIPATQQTAIARRMKARIRDRTTKREIHRPSDLLAGPRV
jgi:hypothetical protein